MMEVRKDQIKTKTGMDPISNPYINHNCDEFLQNPYPTYKLLRILSPFFYWEEKGAWLVTRHRDVVALQDDAIFSLENPRGPHVGQGEVLNRILGRNDLHCLGQETKRRLARKVSAFFSEQNRALLKSRIVEICNQNLLRINCSSRFDLLDGLPQSISNGAISSLLGVPVSQLPELLRFAQAYNELLGPTASCAEQDIKRHIPDLTVGLALIEQAVEAPRKASGEASLIDYLIRLSGEEKSPNYAELVWVIATLAGEGADMARLLIANTVFNLLKHNTVEFLQARPELWDNAVREVLRFDFPLKLGIPRYARRDYLTDDVLISRGDMVCPIIAAAYRDPELFSCPDEFDVTRNTSTVLDENLMSHSFIGLDLALIEAEVVARRLFEDLPGLKVLAPPTYDLHHYTLRSMTSLQLEFSPAERGAL